MDSPQVTVVTLNWNGLHDTIECIDTLLKCDYPSFKIVVVDNRSRDGSLRVLREKYMDKIHVIANKTNLGYAQGMNSGLEYAFKDSKTDYCLVMNNDTTVDGNFIKALVDTAVKHENTGFVTGKVYYYDNPDILQTIGKKYHPVTLNGGHIGMNEKDTGQYDAESELAFCDDIFWLVNRKVWDAVGGYDPEFFLQAEDFEWQIRAKKAGFRIYYTPQAKIWHKESMKLGKASPLKLFYDVRNPIIAIFKHQDKQFCRSYFRHYLRVKVIKPLLSNTSRLRFAYSWAIIKGFSSFIVWYFRQKLMKLQSR